MIFFYYIYNLSQLLILNTYVLSIHETVKLYLTRISCSLGTFTGILIQIHSDLLCHPTCSLALVRWIFCKLVALENSRMISKLVIKTPSANVISHVHAWLLSHCSFEITSLVLKSLNVFAQRFASECCLFSQLICAPLGRFGFFSFD